MWRFILILCSYLMLPTIAQAQVVYEQMDDVVIVEVEGCLNHRVLFYRGGRLMASRLLQDTPTSPQFMQWELMNDGRLRVSWEDWCCDRVIDFNHLSVLRFDHSPWPEGFLPWWDQRRLVVDLKQP